MKGGLLVAGHVIEVPGVAVANPLDTPWCKLDPRDYRVRRTKWIRQIIVHTTKGIWPQYVRAGAGKGGKDKVVADFWRGDPQHSAAQIVVDNDGTVACLCDVATTNAYHATVSNDWSVGIELYQEADGGIHEAVYAAAVPVVLTLCEALSIPLQVPAGSYDGEPLQRLIHGGPDCVGIFGHRDNTSRRGRGDPGDEIFRRLVAAGAEPLDFALRQDIALWRRRQGYLNATHGAKLEVDGIAGPGTIAAMRKAGYTHGRDIPA